MNTEIELKSLRARQFVGVRRVVKQDGIGIACADILPRVNQWLRDKGVSPAGPPMTVYHAVDRESGDFDIQPGFFIDGDVEIEEDLSLGETAGGDALACTHVGSYETIGDTWHAVFARVEELGRTVSKSSWEIYIDDPAEVRLDKLRTEIFVPID